MTELFISASKYRVTSHCSEDEAEHLVSLGMARRAYINTASPENIKAALTAYRMAEKGDSD